MSLARELLDVAAAAALAAGEQLLARAGRPGEIRMKSSATDPVSEADLAAEAAILAVLAARRPSDAVLSEEGGGAERPGGVRWVVDPLDGTVNYLYGIGHWCVSIACEDADGALAGVIYDPGREELFAAARGGPATLDGEPIAGSPAAELGQALVGTGFAYAAAVRERQAALAALVIPRARDVRRQGSAALDLAWAAAGRLDAFYEHGLQPWDRAAGALICACAGLAVHELPGDGPLPPGLLVAPPALAPALLEVLGGE